MTVNTAKLLTNQVGPSSMNTYAILDGDSKTSAIIDPGGDPDLIFSMVTGYSINKILITHGHPDHTLALDHVRNESQAPVYIHPADGEMFGISQYIPLENGQVLSIGTIKISVIHVPGHTPGQCCFDLGDGRIVVGDSIFVGGPGRTGSPEDFTTTMASMQDIVFRWPDDTRFYPGHGPSGIIGHERPVFESFVKAGWPPETQGDITWVPN